MAKKEKKPAKKVKKEKQPVSPKQKMIRLIIIIVAALVLIGGTVILAKFILWPRYKEYRKKHETEIIEKEKIKKKEMGEVIKLEEITVNTFGSNGYRYVVAGLAIETSDPKISEEIILREPQIRDGLIHYFRSKTAQQISKLSFHDSARIDIDRIVNDLLTTGEIDSIYIIKLLIQ